MTELMNDPIIKAILSDEFSTILISIAIIVIVPMLMKLLYHVVSIIVYIVTYMVSLIKLAWAHWGGEIEKWYREDFLPLFASKKGGTE